MKKLITIIALTFLCNASQSQVLTKSDSANIKTIKGAVAFEGELKRSLDGLVDVWYRQAKQQGKSEKTALSETLDKLVARISGTDKKE